MDSSMVYFGIGVLLIVGLVVLVGRNRAPVESVDDGLRELGAAVSMAQEAVSAAEQLWKTGRLEKGERFEYVANLMRRYFPDLSDELLEVLIEGAVIQLKSLLVNANVELDVNELAKAMVNQMRIRRPISPEKPSPN
jgi:hypothetical protein